MLILCIFFIPSVAWSLKAARGGRETLLTLIPAIAYFLLINLIGAFVTPLVLLVSSLCVATFATWVTIRIGMSYRMRALREVIDGAG